MHSARVIDLSVASEEQAAPAVSREMQELWFGIADRAWSSLLLVPSGTVEVLALAAGLCEVSYQTASPRPVALLDASGASLEQAAALARQLALRVARDERVLVVVDPVRDNPAALTLGSRCDKALLCVRLGQSDLSSSQETLERCGRDRFLGTVVLRPCKPSKR